MDPSPSGPSRSPSSSEEKRAALVNLLDEMIRCRNDICSEHALNVDHAHCIGCVLVMKHMQDNFPGMKYGTIEQWAEEAAFCHRHEREIMADFLISRGLGGAQT